MPKRDPLVLHRECDLIPNTGNACRCLRSKIVVNILLQEHLGGDPHLWRPNASARREQRRGIGNAALGFPQARNGLVKGDVHE